MRFLSRVPLRAPEQECSGRNSPPNPQPPLAEGKSGNTAVEGNNFLSPRYKYLPNNVRDDPKKRKDMRSVLEGLGCIFKPGTPNPLINSKELTDRAVQEYVRIFGAFPAESSLFAQGFSCLHNAILRVYGLYSNMHEALEGKSTAHSRPTRRMHCDDEGPTPRPPKAVERVYFGDVCTPEEQFFIDTFLQECGSRAFQDRDELGRTTVYLPLSRNGPDLSIFEPFLFRKTDIPALILAAKLRFSTAEVVEEAIRCLRENFTREKCLKCPEIEMSLRAAWGFYMDQQVVLREAGWGRSEEVGWEFDPKRFSPESVRRLHEMFGNPEVFEKVITPLITDVKG